MTTTPEGTRPMTTTPEGTVRVAREGGRGWHFIDKAKYDAKPGDFVLVDAEGKPDPLDHDGDGAPKNPELADLRKQYQAKFGKRPSPKWDADTIRAKLA